MSYQWINSLPEEGELLEPLLFEEILELQKTIKATNCGSYCSVDYTTVRAHYSSNNTSFKGHSSSFNCTDNFTNDNVCVNFDA